MSGRIRPRVGALRRLALVSLVVLLAASSGCLGALSGEGLQYTAEPVTIDDRAVAESGFERRSTETVRYDGAIGGEGASGTVVVASHVVTLGKQYRGAPLGHVVAVSSPQASVLGQRVNPLGMVQSEGLVDRVLGLSTGAEVEGMQPTGNVTMRALGAARTVRRYDASGDRGKVEVFLTRFQHDGDYVIVFGVIPEGAEDGTEAFGTVLSGLNHGDS